MAMTRFMSEEEEQRGYEYLWWVAKWIDLKEAMDIWRFIKLLEPQDAIELDRWADDGGRG